MPTLLSKKYLVETGCRLFCRWEQNGYCMMCKSRNRKPGKIKWKQIIVKIKKIGNKKKKNNMAKKKERETKEEEEEEKK